MVRETICNSFTNYMKEKFLFFVIGITIIVSLITLGCMGFPSDKQRITNTTENILFMGATALPNSPVVIEGYTPENGWQKIKETATDDVPRPRFGEDWYLWTTRSQIEDFWYHEPASVGYTTKVRARLGPNGGVLLPMRSDPHPVICFGQNPNFADFFNNCIALTGDNSARLYTADYRDFGKECFEKINEIREKEGKTALDLYEDEEAGADADAKCTYEDATPQVPHPCPGPGAQNACANGGIDYILNTCLWDQMYKEEQICYQQNPPSGPCATDGCYFDKACQCGHYVNMVTCPDYTKAACGLYEIKPGYYKSVQNFLK